MDRLNVSLEVNKRGRVVRVEKVQEAGEVVPEVVNLEEEVSSTIAVASISAVVAPPPVPMAVVLEPREGGASGTAPSAVVGGCAAGCGPGGVHAPGVWEQVCNDPAHVREAGAAAASRLEKRILAGLDVEERAVFVPGLTAVSTRSKLDRDADVERRDRLEETRKWGWMEGNVAEAFREWKVGECEFKCSICKKRVLAAEMFHRHMRVCHSIEVGGVDSPEYAMSLRVAAVTRCKICDGHVFLDGMYLSYHLRAHGGIELENYFRDYIWRS